MEYIYNTSQILKLSLILHTFSVTGLVIGLFLTGLILKYIDLGVDLQN